MTSSRPSLATVCAIIASMLATSPQSASIAIARRFSTAAPSWLQSAAVRCAAVGSMSAATTIAPFPAIISAIARPMPPPAPVTNTTLSASIVIEVLPSVPVSSSRRRPGSMSAVDTGPRRYDGLGASAPVRQQPAQLGLQDLAVIVFRQRVDQTVFARALEAGDVVEAQAVELRLRHRRAGLCDDEGDDLLAPIGVRQADHRGLDQFGVAQQHLLDLARVDVATARDDHVLRAVAQRQEAVLVEAAEIAGVQPAAAQRLGIGFGVLPITLHDAVASRHHLADLAR